MIPKIPIFAPKNALYMFQLPNEPQQHLPFVCQILDDLLRFLQTQHITQRAVTAATGIGNLSKFRNTCHLSKSYDVQKILERIDRIITHYDISWIQNDTSPQQICFTAPHLNPTPPLTLHYAYYYYSQIERKVMRAYLNIDTANKPTATLSFYNETNLVYTYPPALITKTPNHLVLQITQADTTFFSLTVLYCGNQYWQQMPFLLGTYAGIRQRDNKPVCGRLLLQQFASQSQFVDSLSQNIDLNIQQWLLQKSDEAPNSLVFNVQELK